MRAKRAVGRWMSDRNTALRTCTTTAQHRQHHERPQVSEWEEGGGLPFRGGGGGERQAIAPVALVLGEWCDMRAGLHCLPAWLVAGC